MKKPSLVVIGFVLVLLTFGITAKFLFRESSTYAQGVNSTQKDPGIDDLSQTESALIVRIKQIADKIDERILEKDPKWKLEKKFAGQTSVGFLPQSSGGGRVFGTSAYLQFKKQNLTLNVNFDIKEPSTNEDVSANMKLGLNQISRGIVNVVSGIGDEAYIVSDIVGSRSNFIYVAFRNSRFVTTIGVNSPKGSRKLHEDEAKNVARIVDSIIAESDSKK